MMVVSKFAVIVNPEVQNAVEKTYGIADCLQNANKDGAALERKYRSSHEHACARHHHLGHLTAAALLFSAQHRSSLGLGGRRNRRLRARVLSSDMGSPAEAEERGTWH